MEMRPLIEALPPDFSLTLVDVGSAGGLNRRWKPFLPILTSILFDPRERDATGELGRGKTRVYPAALGDREGSATLFLTSMANMSSFLEPDQAVFARYGKKLGHASVIATESVRVERLDDLIARDGFTPDVLKVDTQGSELMVLAGAEKALRSVLLAEIEVSFFHRYMGQPLIADIASHMSSHGFELIDLLKPKRYRYSNSFEIRNVAVRGNDRSGRIAYADAIFVRREEDILHDAGSLLKSAVALVAYGKADMAARLLDRGRDILPGGQADAIGHALGRLRTGFIRRLLGHR